MSEPEKIDLASLDVAAQKRAELKQILGEKFPEILSDGLIHFDQLKRVLGEWVEPGKERFGLAWPGKAACLKIIQQPSFATLKPMREESVDFDRTENVYIEGDNLEVLKLLQKSYFSKIKMIYIDPPYNTGHEFIYPDKFSETLEAYLEYTGQRDGGGRKFSTNTDASGRYHSNWLNMMYPRLYLAKNLLREDGVIFISIDHHEVSRLRELCDNIFGEENLEGLIAWRRRHNQPNDPTKMIGLVSEYIIVYAKNSIHLKSIGVGKLDVTGKFSNPDNDPRGDWASKPWKVGSGQSGSYYKIETPNGKIYEEEWMGEEKTFKQLSLDGRIYYPDKGNGPPRKKYFKCERDEEGQCATNWWPHEQFGHNQAANEEISRLFGVKNIFSNPKPTNLIKNFMNLANLKNSDIILDFFSGSATTAHAMMRQNAQDGGARRFIMVQLPEPCAQNSEAFKAGYKTIADIGRARIRRAGKKLLEERVKNHDGQLALEKASPPPDIGFKAFKLDRSNFSPWNFGDGGVEELEQQLKLHIDPIDKASTSEDLLYEIILKSGYALAEPIRSIRVGDNSAYSLRENSFIICLDDQISPAFADELIKYSPSRVVCLDRAFAGDDQLKANLVQTFKSRAQAEKTEIVFQTV